MIAEWATAVAIVCSEPRVPFFEFFEKVTLMKYPGERGEQMDTVNSRALRMVGFYADYAEVYRDQCPRRATALSSGTIGFSRSTCYANGKQWPARIKLGPSPLETSGLGVGSYTCYAEDEPK